MSKNTVYLSAAAIMREMTADMPKAVISGIYAAMMTALCSVTPVIRTEVLGLHKIPADEVNLTRSLLSR